MNLMEFEARVLAIFEKVSKKLPVEDSRVEIKSEWPEPSKAARRIAGHANSAHGEWIIWVVGLDEKSGRLVDVEENQFASWWSETQSYFEGVSPEIKTLVVPVSTGSIVALLISTDRFPFVVRNSAYGKQGAGPVEFEVPWREGTATRSARRADLISLVSPLTRAPKIELLSAVATLVIEDLENARKGRLSFSVRLYVIPHSFDVLIIPVHRSSIEITTNLESIAKVFTHVELVPEVQYVGDNIFNKHRISSSPNADISRSELVLRGPTRLTLNLDEELATEKLDQINKIKFKYAVQPIGSDAEMFFSITLGQSGAGKDGKVAYTNVVEVSGFESY